MRLLDRAHAVLERLVPGLADEVGTRTLAQRESVESDVVELFRKCGGSGIAIPCELDGRGASVPELVQVHCALGALSPSLAIGATMHNHSVLSLLQFADVEPSLRGLLGGIAKGQLLVASAYAEGKPRADLFMPSMRGRPVPGGYRVSGVKKPCSLARSMDLFTTLFSIPHPERPETAIRAHAVLSAKSPGVRSEPFWQAPILQGAQSMAVMLDDVFVPEALTSLPDVRPRAVEREMRGVVAFQLLATASYVGAAARVVEAALDAESSPAVHRASMVVELESAALALAHVASTFDQTGPQHSAMDLYFEALSARYAAQTTIARVAALAAECVGGIRFITDPTLAYYCSVVRALAFHPPSAASTAEQMARFGAGTATHMELVTTNRGPSSLPQETEETRT